MDYENEPDDFCRGCFGWSEAFKRQREFLNALLTVALHQLENHNSDYHHQTPEHILNEIKQAIAK